MRKGLRTQLVLPLLETLREAGGRAKPAEVYESVADKLDLTPEERAETFAWRGRELNAFNRHVRWARQTALLKGLLAAPQRGIWELTDIGGDRLLNCKRGVVVTVFTTPSGAALWSTAESALGVIDDGSVDLLFSSPPYVGAMAKEYGEFDEAYWLDFMSDLAGEWRKKLSPTGSIMLNLGSTYEPKRPTVSPYIERFTLRMIDQHKFHLLDRLYWDNTNRLPSPFHWVAMRRVRLKPSVEPILWFGATPEVKANNRNVLVPYGDWMKRRLSRAAAGEAVTMPDGARPSGHRFTDNSFTRDNGGAIAPTVIRACAGGPEQRRYAKACRADGLPTHGATMPAEVAEFCIKFATDENDLVYDPFGGSLTTGAVAERLGRRWIANDRSLAYLAGSRHRFPTIEPCGPILADALGAFRSAA